MIEILGKSGESRIDPRMLSFATALCRSHFVLCASYFSHSSVFDHTEQLADTPASQSSMPPAPSVTQIQSLYSASVTAAQRFTSYNFHNYFLRRTDEVFKPVLAAINPPPGSTPAKPLESAELAKFYEEETANLEVMKRASEVNRMFEGPKLVVEHARPITSGGGAGMEASAGGGGQPV